MDTSLTSEQETRRVDRDLGRTGPTEVAPLAHSVRLVTDWAQQTRNPDGSRVIDAEWVQVLLGRAHARATVLALLTEQLGDAAAAADVFGEELTAEVHRALMEVVGPKSVVTADSPGAVLRGHLEHAYRASRGTPAAPEGNVPAVQREQTTDDEDAAGLARAILDHHCTPETLRAAEDSGTHFDHDLWRRFADSGLVSLTVPEEHNGSGSGMVELADVLAEVGRHLAPLPLAVHAVTAMALARFGNQTQQARWLPVGGLGEFVLTTALSEERVHVPLEPITRAESDGAQWLLTGSKAVVPAGPLADLFVVPAETAQGLTVLLVHADDPGVVVVPQQVTGRDVAARLELDRAAVPLDRVLGTIGDGREVVEWLAQHLTVALCAEQVGVVEGALALAASPADQTRLAHAQLDALGARLALGQAARRLDEGRAATREVAVAKLWAADAGHRAARETLDVLSGSGADLDDQAHRFLTAATRLELALGGTTEQARVIGASLAAETS
jgi:alkylation response protein AidB-like acyl-CoA dehydrogenase